MFKTGGHAPNTHVYIKVDTSFDAISSSAFECPYSMMVAV